MEAEPVWVFPGSSAEFWFSGEVLRIHVENFNEYWQNYLGCILDQVQSAFYLKKSGETVIEVRVPENESGVHHVLFFKRQDGCHELKILGFEIGDGERLIELPPPENQNSAEDPGNTQTGSASTLQSILPVYRILSSLAQIHIKYPLNFLFIAHTSLITDYTHHTASDAILHPSPHAALHPTAPPETID